MLEASRQATVGKGNSKGRGLCVMNHELVEASLLLTWSGMSGSSKGITTVFVASISVCRCGERLEERLQFAAGSGVEVELALRNLMRGVYRVLGPPTSVKHSLGSSSDS